MVQLSDLMVGIQLGDLVAADQLADLVVAALPVCFPVHRHAVLDTG